jgi:hypothetical protein
MRRPHRPPPPLDRTTMDYRIAMLDENPLDVRIEERYPNRE